MSHTPYCIDLVASAVNLPHPNMISVLANTNVKDLRIPAGGVLSVMTSVPGVLTVTFDDKSVVALPVPPGVSHWTLPDVGLSSVTATTTATIAVWDGASQLQTNRSFTKE